MIAPHTEMLTKAAANNADRIERTLNAATFEKQTKKPKNAHDPTDILKQENPQNNVQILFNYKIYFSKYSCFWS